MKKSVSTSPKNIISHANFDFILFFNVCALVAIGLIMVFSAAATESLRANDPFFYLKRQLIFVAIGFLALYIGFKIDFSKYRKWSGQILLLSFFLLGIVFIPFIGRSAGGATRWIDLGFFSFQPSEFAKLGVIIYLADSITRKKKIIGNFLKGILPILTIVAFACLLILKQPDLGTVLVIFGTALIMFYLGGAKLVHIIFLILISSAFFIFASFISPYRKRRLLAYINPWKDPKGVGFHIIQSLIAVGSGGFFGLGLGGSRQKFLYLPEQYTDFIFAILCEETGFLGALLVIILFIGVAARGFYIGRKSPDDFGSLLAFGLSSFLILQALINIGVVVGLIPTTGIPLPFISYGGTSLIVSLYSVGILLNISSSRISR